MRRFGFKALCMLAVLAMVLSGFQPASAGSGDQEGTLRCAIESFTSLNPITAEGSGARILDLIYEPALKKDPETGDYVPYIAVGSANGSSNELVTWSDCSVGSFGYSPREAWLDAAKPEIVIFYDFGGVKWHDGVQMTIRDVLFTFHFWSRRDSVNLGNPLADRGGGWESNYTATQWLFVEKVWESQDSSRAALKFTLQNQRFSLFEHYLLADLMPYHIWGTTRSNQKIDDTMIWCDPGYNGSDEFSWKYYLANRWSNPTPMGSGPFKWYEQVGGTLYIKPWKQHFYRPGFKYYSYDAVLLEQPSIETYVLRTYSSEEQALNDLEAGYLDYIAWDVSPISLGRFSNNPAVAHVSLRATSMVYLGFNMGSESFGYVRNYPSTVPLGTDYAKPLRKALVHCVDFQGLKVLSNPLAGDMDALATFSAWSNESAPSYAFDPPETVNILMETGYVLEDPYSPPGEGNWWHNPDGTPIGSGTNGTVEVLAPESSYDAVMFQAGSMIVSQMREVGIRAALITLDPYTLSARVTNGDYDICIIDQEFPEHYRARPESYYFDYFHSSGMYGGLNFIGYDNRSFDREVERAIATTEVEVERQCFRDATAALAYDLPIVPLYYESRLEVYGPTTVDGLLDDGSGSMLNHRSMASVFRQEKAVLTARFTATPLTCKSNSTWKVNILVEDENDDPVPGAAVRLESSSGQLLQTTGRTDRYGFFTTNFTAPYVEMVETYNNWEIVRFTIKEVTMQGYVGPPEVELAITVFPERDRTMVLEASFDQDVITDRDPSGATGFTNLIVSARDLGGMPLDGVDIALGCDMPGVAFDRDSVETDAGGTAIIRVFAPDVTDTAEITVQINATKRGFYEAVAEMSFMVEDGIVLIDNGEVSTGTSLVIPIAGSVVLFACAALIYSGMRARRGRKR